MYLSASAGGVFDALMAGDAVANTVAMPAINAKTPK